MAVRLVTPDGFRFECDSAAEAGQMYQLLSHREDARQPEHQRNSAGAPTALHAENPPAHQQRRTEQPSFRLSEEGRRIILALVEHPDGLSTDALAEAAGIEPKMLPSFSRAATNALTKLGYRDPVIRERAYLEGSNKSLYRISREVAEKFTEDQLGVGNVDASR